MKSFTSIALLALAGRTIAQASCIPAALAIPNCAQSCLLSAGSANGCAATAFDCQASKTVEIGALVTPCVVDACPFSELGNVQSSVDALVACAQNGRDAVAAPAPPKAANTPAARPAMVTQIADGQIQAPKVAPLPYPTAPASAASFVRPSVAPSSIPSAIPSIRSIPYPSRQSSIASSIVPTVASVMRPSVVPSLLASSMPSSIPSFRSIPYPRLQSSIVPSMARSSMVGSMASAMPSFARIPYPSQQSSVASSMVPSVVPSFVRIPYPSMQSSVASSMASSMVPSMAPSAIPSAIPSVVASSVPMAMVTQIADGQVQAPVVEPLPPPEMRRRNKLRDLQEYRRRHARA